MMRKMKKEARFGERAVPMEKAKKRAPLVMEGCGSQISMLFL
jgi:hypothetical protein